MRVLAQTADFKLVETNPEKGLGYVINLVNGARTDEKAIVSLIGMADDWEDVDADEPHGQKLQMIRRSKALP